MGPRLDEIDDVFSMVLVISCYLETTALHLWISRWWLKMGKMNAFWPKAGRLGLLYLRLAAAHRCFLVSKLGHVRNPRGGYVLNQSETGCELKWHLFFFVGELGFATNFGDVKFWFQSWQTNNGVEGKVNLIFSGSLVSYMFLLRLAPVWVSPGTSDSSASLCRSQVAWNSPPQWNIQMRLEIYSPED